VLPRFAFALIVLPIMGLQSVAQSAPAATASPEPSAAQTFDLSDEVVRDILAKFQRGIEDHNLERTLSIFDPDAMQDFPRFRDQMVAFFRLYDSIKFRYQLLQVNETKDTGFATADVDMDADPADILSTQHRRTTQMRFQIKRIGAVWKVTDLQPIDFFTQ
jgi:hypothetical protein